jgi:hypothetical protein
MPYFTKKPVEIEARQFVESEAAELAAWCGGSVVINDLSAEPSIAIYTLEGIMAARLGDWLIRGVNGEFYPCKPDIFEKTYDVAEAPVDPYHIEVLSMEDQPDGSALMEYRIGSEALKTFANIGLLKVLQDKVDELKVEVEDFDTNVGC